MNNRVILFLTSPNSVKRRSMCLENFKQLKKLGYDIITLSTHDSLPDFIIENSKMVVYDYNRHECSSKKYHDFFKNSNGYGYFYVFRNDNHSVFNFTKTHFPSLMRNTRTLISLGKAFNYNEYFFVEDDHFFHDDDLTLVKSSFDKLSESEMVVFGFDRNGQNDGSDIVYCTYFHFGKFLSVDKIIKSFPYTENEFVEKHPDICFNFYEYYFKTLIIRNKPENFKIHEIIGAVSNFFKKSKINIIYSFFSPLDDSRCNFILDVKTNKPIFYFHTLGLNKDVNLKIYVGNVLHENRTIGINCWYVSIIDSNLINDTVVILDNKKIKYFKNLDVDNIIYNGQFIKN